MRPGVRGASEVSEPSETMSRTAAMGWAARSGWLQADRRCGDPMGWMADGRVADRSRDDRCCCESS